MHKHTGPVFSHKLRYTEGRDGHLDQSEAHNTSQRVGENGPRLQNVVGLSNVCHVTSQVCSDLHLFLHYMYCTLSYCCLIAPFIIRISYSTSTQALWFKKPQIT